MKCVTKLWHPNISVTGDICLSLLRQNSIDGLGWVPTRTLKDVIWGLNSLFTVSQMHPLRIITGFINTLATSCFQDLLNFEDPLNNDAADQYKRDKKEFLYKVREYISLYGRR